MALRLVLCIEATARQQPLWATLSRGVLEPLLAMLQALQRVELALVLFGAHPPHSLAAVESSGWVADVQAFRQLLEGVQLSGGGRQPVALAEALAEAAALFALQQGGAAGGGEAPPQQHCLVCIASDPAPHPVAWPYPQDCCLVRCRRLPGGSHARVVLAAGRVRCWRCCCVVMPACRLFFPHRRPGCQAWQRRWSFAARCAGTACSWAGPAAAACCTASRCCGTSPTC